MRHARAYALAGLTAFTVGAVAFAQSTIVPLEAEAPVESAPLERPVAGEILAGTTWGDPENGSTLAATCAACHGLDGKSTVRDIYPSIGGQSEHFIARQLALYKSGERDSPIMAPFAEMLEGQDMRDLGAFFATRTLDAGIADDSLVESGPYEGMKFYEIGQQLYRSGDAARNLPACMACHGPSGAGNPGPPWPAVAGQPSWFSAQRLQEYRSGSANHADRQMFDIMAEVAASLTDEEIQALASYMEGLHPRPDPALRAAIASAAEAAPAPVAAPEPAPEPVEAGDDASSDDAAPPGSA